MRRLFPALLCLLMLSACSTKKNTAASRFWHGFTARYNTYYNGQKAFAESFEQQERGHKDDYTEVLPLFPVAVEATSGIGKGGYETAITKAQKAIKLHSIQAKPNLSARERQTPKGRQQLARQEYNPFLKNAWLMMGKAQFQRGEFIEAASTFSYIARHYAAEPRVAAEARIWLARCYSQTDWFYDAENALHLIRHDSLTHRLRRERDVSQADILLRQGRYEEALPLLKSAAAKSGSRLQRARTWYIIGQVSRMAGKNDEAYKALRKVTRMSPPFELEFNARILQTQVLSTDGSQRSRMINKLKRMARNPKYKDYLHQVYFALGNIQLARGDTAAAISAYEEGRTKSQSGSTEKGVLLLSLGEIYWTQQRFDKAQTCYSEAIGMLNKEREGYAEAIRRSKILDKLVPYTNAIHLQDSLQELASMSEEDRNAAIDRQIEMERRRQEEARRASRDSAAQALAGGGDAGAGILPGTGMAGTSTTGAGASDAGTFYFYNPQLVQQGKQRFQQQWGNRKNEDNWRRSNRTVLSELSPDDDETEEELSDSALQAQALADSLAQALADSLSQDENNPLKREYYLKQIPFTPEAKAASDLIIMDALHHAGVIEKDDLGDFALAEKSLTRIVRQYTSYEQMSDVYYQLFLMYLRWKKPAQANHYRNLMAQHYPQSDTTRIITHPNFERNLQFGRQIEDSLYTATYNAFRLHDDATVARNTQRSTEEFPDGVNRPKFLFVNALSRMGKEDNTTIISELRELVKKYPDSDVSHLAGMIVKGLENGRSVGKGGYDVGSLWSRRSQTAQNDSTDMATEFEAERAVPFVCLLAYPTDSIDNNQLLYAVARFNFTHFTSRTFDLESVRYTDITQFIVKGFSGYAEAHAYAQQFYVEPQLATMVRKGRLVLISEKNLKLLGTAFSYDDYQKFFDENYAPMELPDSVPLDEPPMQYYEDELPPGRQGQSEAQPEHRDDPLEAEDEDEIYDIPITGEEDETYDLPIIETEPQQPQRQEEPEEQPEQQPSQRDKPQRQEEEDEDDGEWYPI